MPVPSLLRRRITPIGRRVMEAAWTVLAGQQKADAPDPQNQSSHSQFPRIVLASRHGEYDRTFGLLQSLPSGEVSPAEFGLSVHHSLTGLLSIATGNQEGHTAISAVTDTLSCGLLEAISTEIDTNRPVLFLYFDQPLPPQYASLPQTGPEDFSVATAIALLLTPGPPTAHLCQTSAPDDGPVRQAAADALISALQCPTSSPVRLGRRWIWQECAE